MLFRFDDLDRTLSFLEDVQRTFDHAVNRWGHQDGCSANAGGPWRVSQTDETVIVNIDLPGVRSPDLELTLDGDVLTIKGTRQVTPPDGYRVQMDERGAQTFTRKLTIQSPVDPERVEAGLADGVLTVTLTKTDAARPVTIPIQTS
jgi:HSP20 family protein